MWGKLDKLILDAGFWILDGGNLRTDSSYLMLDNLWKLLWIVLVIGYWFFALRLKPLKIRTILIFNKIFSIEYLLTSMVSQ